ncbi:MAG: formate dehydrogenase accessory sulfurtransferase FdhD [Gluconobacter potus]|uniref:formate dehydrogenase accessory sulfurtransferase FdhD n=1 Tax=Gluconobacter potus TaxID=2724927 RepID=UPI0039E966B2
MSSRQMTSNDPSFEDSHDPGRKGDVNEDALFQTVKVAPLGVPEAAFLLNIADEVPIRLIFNGIFPYGVMMMTPEHLEDFAYGFCLTEEIIQSAEQIRCITITHTDNGPAMDITIAGNCLTALLRRRPRAQTGHTSCGICGSEAVPSVETVEDCALPLAHTITIDALRRALNDLDVWQELNAVTRMVHAAAWADVNGQIQIIREDVGRHNALDKLIGARLRDDSTVQTGFCLLTSRYSFEMALKSLRAGIAIVVAVSAPTYRAYNFAQKMNQTLIAIARRDRQIVFCGGERIT